MIVQTARGWLGVPFRHQGRDRRGVDCVGLVVVVGVACGVLTEPPAAVQRYRRIPRPGQLHAALCEWLVPVGVPSPGDVVLVGRNPSAIHAGIWAGSSIVGDTIIHADAYLGRVVESLVAGDAVAFFKYPGAL